MGPNRVADSCATGCILLSGVSMTDVNEVTQFIAGVLTIVVGLVSLYARFKKRK